MDQTTHRHLLAAQAVETLNRYTQFHSDYQVSFALAPDDEQGFPRIQATFTRFDGVPFAESSAPLDKKFLGLKDGSTVAIRLFFFPMMRKEFDETQANQFDVVDFDYAAMLGYGKDGDDYVLKALYLPPTDAVLFGHKPDEDGVWRTVKPPMYSMHKLSLDPRQTFSRHLYLAERFAEALEYQHDKYGFFFSNPDA